KPVNKSGVHIHRIGLDHNRFSWNGNSLSERGDQAVFDDQCSHVDFPTRSLDDVYIRDCVSSRNRRKFLLILRLEPGGEEEGEQNSHPAKAKIHSFWFCWIFLEM